MRFAAFCKLYDLHSSARLQTSNSSNKLFEKTALFGEISAKIWQMLQNLQNDAKILKFQLDNLEDFEKCCKTRIYTPPLGGQKTQAFWLAPQKNLLALMLVRHFQSRCGVPRCEDRMM